MSSQYTLTPNSGRGSGGQCEVALSGALKACALDKQIPIKTDAGSKMPDNNQSFPNQHLEDIARQALELGATASAVISSSEIQVKDELARLCNGAYTCPKYGLAASCPPHVEGPVELRKWLAMSQYAITVKIELPTSVMFSDERSDIMRLLHRIVAAIEQKAVQIGFEKSKGFAGGSCKELFCDDQKTCCVVAENKDCRHMAIARPSMSGFGIDVTRLILSSGWAAPKAKASEVADTDAASWVAGLIILA